MPPPQRPETPFLVALGLASPWATNTGSTHSTLQPCLARDGCQWALDKFFQSF